jgi:hypothetical protein
VTFPYETLTLKPGKEQALLRFHPEGEYLKGLVLFVE